MVERKIKPATITNIANETDIDSLREMVNAWLEEEDLPLDSWDEIEVDEPYQAEILRVAIARWDALIEETEEIA